MDVKVQLSQLRVCAMVLKTMCIPQGRCHGLICILASVMSPFDMTLPLLYPKTLGNGFAHLGS